MPAVLAIVDGQVRVRINKFIIVSKTIPLVMLLHEQLKIFGHCPFKIYVNFSNSTISVVEIQ